MCQFLNNAQTVVFWWFDSYNPSNQIIKQNHIRKAESDSILICDIRTSLDITMEPVV